MVRIETEWTFVDIRLGGGGCRVCVYGCELGDTRVDECGIGSKQFQNPGMKW